MPTVTTLSSGAVLKMKGREHLPHHVHVEWKEEEVLLQIADGEVYAGEVPSHVLAEARAYIAENRDTLCERFFALNPNLPRPRPESKS
jgi:hypothetical protein